MRACKRVHLHRKARVQILAQVCRPFLTKGVVADFNLLDRRPEATYPKLPARPTVGVLNPAKAASQTMSRPEAPFWAQSESLRARGASPILNSAELCRRLCQTFLHQTRCKLDIGYCFVSVSLTRCDTVRARHVLLLKRSEPIDDRPNPENGGKLKF